MFPVNPNPTFVADFHYPCAVYSVLWLLQQFNPESPVPMRMAEQLERDRNDNNLRLWCRHLGITDPEDYFHVFQTLRDLFWEHGLLAPVSVDFFNALDAQDEFGFVPSPVQLVNASRINPQNYTVVY